MIHYYSTNHLSDFVSFEQALMRGLAPDGGLYFPDQFPRFSADEIAKLRGASLSEVAYRTFLPWLYEEIDLDAIRQIATEAQNFPIVLREVGEFFVLELFHGPTLAFKDVAAQNLPRLMSYFLQKTGQRITLLVATSGDTGGAIAHGFSNIPNIELFVLFPKGRVSALQEEQLTRVASNVHPVEVDGVFDDCQAIVKRAFNDPALAHLRLTSANSISIGRLLPQIIYYIYTYAQLQREDIEFIVPSGNFGNLTGGLFAREMGMPFSSFIAATNSNDSAVRYMATGEYKPLPTIQTLSNAMDVGNPSNFVRILELFDHDYKQVCNVLQAYQLSDEETISTIQRVWHEHGYLLDPHTAVGWLVAERYGDPEMKRVIVATAAPVKFAQEIEKTAGIAIDDSAEIARLRQLPQRKNSIPNDYTAFTELLLRSAILS